MKKIDKKYREKHDVKFVKLNKLSKEEWSKINMGDLWILRPKEGTPSVMMRLCGCRAVCLA